MHATAALPTATVQVAIVADSVLSESESWSELCAWSCCCCLRGDGTSLGVRALDLISRSLFWAAGLTSGDPATFNRPRWDRLTASQDVAASSNDRGVATSDILIPSLRAGEPAVSARRYTPRVAGSVGPSTPVLLFFHGGG